MSTAASVGPNGTRDVVVIGGGIAGLAAAWKLRSVDVLLLEREDRVGGRIKSEPREAYWLSVGAHMFPGRASVVGGLVEEMGLETLPIGGSLLGISYRNKIVTGARTELYPLRLPLSVGGRLSLIRAGLKVRAAARRYNELGRTRKGESASDARSRLLAYLGDRSFAEYIGRLHPEVEAIFRAIANRLTAEPEEVSAGCVASLFAHVWSDADVVLSYSLRGGPSELPKSLARTLGERVVLRAEVREVTHKDGLVRVRYRTPRGEEQVFARAAVVATPSVVTRRIVDGLDEETANALDAITAGPMVVASLLTNERRPMPWDGLYSVLTVGRSFNMLFNHASALRSREATRQPGGVIMLYGGAGLARRLIDKSDEEIRSAMLADLYEIYPDTRGIVQEVVVQRWSYTVPFAAPGRHLVQAALERPIHASIFLAGDYIGAWVDMESAASTGIEAAEKARQLLRSRRGTFVPAGRS